MEFLERLNFYQVLYFMYLESILPDRYIRLKPLLITSLYPFGWEIVVWNLWRLSWEILFLHLQCLHFWVQRSIWVL